MKSFEASEPILKIILFIAKYRNHLSLAIKQSGAPPFLCLLSTLFHLSCTFSHFSVCCSSRLYGNCFSHPSFLWVSDLFSPGFLFLALCFSGKQRSAAINSIGLLFPRQSLPRPTLPLHLRIPHHFQIKIQKTKALPCLYKIQYSKLR